MGEGASDATEGAVSAVADLRAAVADLRANLDARDIDERLTGSATCWRRSTATTTNSPPSTRGPRAALPRARSSSPSTTSARVTDWYAPAAVVLMLQQFGVAFGALTFVRERQLGIIDIFRVAPINATETLLGKYLAYLLLGCGDRRVLTVLVVTTLGRARRGERSPSSRSSWRLTLFASIGLGFVISLASANDAQAVQYTMILLLASLFFSGFFLSVGQLEGAAR